MPSPFFFFLNVAYAAEKILHNYYTFAENPLWDCSVTCYNAQFIPSIIIYYDCDLSDLLVQPLSCLL
ncbi:hypothetical protein SAMN05216311_11758 [Chitinophaga sp. CF418]|nr:hypothetical protein SAMN05216311_11758 [Chitinophaga sp. CF418]